jgi:hypothetical protein
MCATDSTGWVRKGRRIAPVRDFIGIELCSYHRKQQPSSNSKETVTESANSIMIKRWLLHILEHGTVPAVALAVAIAPTNSRSWQRHDLPPPIKRETEILFSVPTTDTMTLAARVDFTFSPSSTCKKKGPPLSWHLRTEEQAKIGYAWNSIRTGEQTQEVLAYLGLR